MTAMGLSIKPSDAQKDAAPMTTVDTIIEQALYAVSTEGKLDDKGMSIRLSKTERQYLLDLQEQSGLKRSPIMRVATRVLAMLYLNRGATSQMLLATDGLLDHEDRYEAASERVISRLLSRIPRLRAKGTTGEARAAKVAEQVRRKVEAWEDEFWREQTLGRYEREIRPLLKGELPQRPRVVAMQEAT
jgi:hypothetical protein